MKFEVISADDKYVHFKTWNSFTGSGSVLTINQFEELVAEVRRLQEIERNQDPYWVRWACWPGSYWEG